MKGRYNSPSSRAVVGPLGIQFESHGISRILAETRQEGVPGCKAVNLRSLIETTSKEGNGIARQVPRPVLNRGAKGQFLPLAVRVLLSLSLSLHRACRSLCRATDSPDCCWNSIQFQRRKHRTAMVPVTDPIKLECRRSRSRQLIITLCGC